MNSTRNRKRIQTKGRNNKVNPRYKSSGTTSKNCTEVNATNTEGEQKFRNKVLAVLDWEPSAVVSEENEILSERKPCWG